MPFNSRPNLDDDQFRQISGTTLTLNGEVIIGNKSGLKLTGDSGVIPIIVTGGTDNYVMTYLSGKIVLAEPTASGGSGNYSYTDLTTCTVGGLQSGSNVYNCSVVDILHTIISPTLSPTLVPNSNTLSIIPTSTIYEVGCQVAFTACGTYNQGSVSPVYCSGPSVRTGLPTRYSYTDIGGGVCNVTTTSLNNCVTLPLRSIVLGNNVVYGNVSYSAGQYPKNSDGSCMVGMCCASGITSPSKQVTVAGVLPYFWGSSATPPTINQALINTSCKCVGYSNSDVLVSNYNVTGKYIWFAIPATSTSKTKWQGSNSPSNCGTIPGDLFSTQTTCTISSPSSCWSSETYKFYVSNYPTSINYGMTFKNS